MRRRPAPDRAKRRSAAALTALGLLAGAPGCHPLDRRAPFERALYAAQHEAVEAVAEEAPLAEGPLEAGWARVRIRPPDGGPLAGYGDRDGAPSEGVLDPAFVRAFALRVGDQVAVLFTADLLLIGRQVADRVRARLADRLGPRATFFTASHTHSGPGGSVPGLVWEAAMGPFDEAAQDAVVEAHVAAARAALEDLAPATLGHARVRVPGLAVNRVERGGAVDDELLLVRLAKADGDRVAALWVYGCHPVTLPPENLRISGDYPGMVASALEGEALELLGFAAGGVGSTNPKHERPHDQRWIVAPLVRATKAALRAAATRAKGRVRLSFATARLRRPDLHYRIAREMEVWSAPVAAVLDMPYADYGALIVDDLALSFLPAEISGTLTRDARRRAARRGVTLAVLPFNGTYLGYVVPRRVYDLPEEAGADMLHYETHVVSFLGPWGADYLMNLGLSLVEDLWSRLHPGAGEAFAR